MIIKEDTCNIVLCVVLGVLVLKTPLLCTAAATVANTGLMVANGLAVDCTFCCGCWVLGGLLHD